MRFTRRARGQGGVTAGLTQLRGYRPDWFRADLLAGITVTAYLVPQCLAYADLAGVEPVTGLWVAVVAMVAYALLGTSRQLSVGPESATAVMVAAAVAPLAAGDPAKYAALAAGLALMVGLVCIAAFVLRLGLPRGPAVAADPDRLHGRGRADHDRVAAGHDHRDHPDVGRGDREDGRAVGQGAVTCSPQRSSSASA